ncbi:ammonium transporter [Tabrizicola sp.]|uniref:ammonium transporter n=1 Tax=Tabrizicola sp. TaxID=2005166 RepID=UPI003F303E55
MVGADTAWLMISTVLVLFMTLPGLALFYGGLVRASNVVSIFLQCFAITITVSLVWFAVGYSIAFGDGNAIWGGLGKVFLNGIGQDTLRGTIPENLFFLFQMSFAIITPALIIGAFVERVRFAFVLIFSAIWVLVVFCPVAYWVWGGGFLGDGGIFGATGVRDFAGGIVVHGTAGSAALVLAVMIGPREDRTQLPHNPGYVAIGAAMLWIGWFGFNGGSALASNGSAASAMVVTHIAATAGAATWCMWESLKTGKFTLVGLMTGAVAGLATATPTAGYTHPVFALISGGLAGILCQEAMRLIRMRLDIDDSLDVFAVHCVGGSLGILLLAAFGAAPVFAQVGSLVICLCWTIVVTYMIVRLLSGVMAMRVNPADEARGLDVSTHGELGYIIDN